MTTPPLFMVRLDPDMERVTRWAQAENVAPPGDDGGYAWHALLKAAFAEASPQPFRIVDSPSRASYLLGYVRADEPTLRNQSALAADPAVAAALGLDMLAVKRMPDTFSRDQHLGFEVRVRPTVRQDRDGDRRRSRERDVFLAAVERAGARGTRPELDRNAVYLDWLRTRLETGGATLIDGRIIAQRRAVLARKDSTRKLATVGTKGGGPDVTFTGMLRVAEPDQFRRLLARGVGRHRAFGFGMLLLKPVIQG